MKTKRKLNEISSALKWYRVRDLNREALLRNSKACEVRLRQYLTIEPFSKIRNVEG